MPEKYAESSNQVLFGKPGPGRWLGYLLERTSQGFILIGGQESPHNGWEYTDDDSLCSGSIGSLADLSQEQQVVPVLSKTAKKIKDSVDNSPRQTAGNHLDQQDMGFAVIGASEAEGAGKGKDYDQPKQNL